VGVCGVNIWRHRWQDRDDDLCPRCHTTETSRHVYLCTDPAVTELWDNELSNFEQWLEDQQTAPSITRDIIINLRHLAHHEPPGNSSVMEIGQSRIGWENFMEGIIHTQWEQTQQEHYRLHIQPFQRFIPDARGWTRRLFKKIWDIHHTFWISRNAAEHQSDGERLLQQLNEEI
jgi:hypothetical protein